MRISREGVFGALVLVLCMGFVPSAIGGQRTFVSGTGNDGNAGNGCSLAFPCRSFSSAIGQTTAGGEVIVLDSAGYGPVTITQSVSIVAPRGVYAGVSVLAGDGITINAGANDTVVLRGLVVNGIGGVNGVVVNSARTVDLGSIEISGFSSDGIKVSGGSLLVVRDSVSRGNTGHGLNFSPAGTSMLAVERSSFDVNDVGILVNGGSVTGSIAESGAVENATGGFLAQGGAVLILNDCRVVRTKFATADSAIRSDGASTRLQAARCTAEGYGRGFHATSGGAIQVVDSAAMGPGPGSGFFAEGAGSVLDAERSAATNYALGFRADGGGTLRMSACTVTGVNTSLFNGTGTLFSRQNNTVSIGSSGVISVLSPL